MVFKAAGYRVRYGKGNFQAGYARLDEKKNIVINRLFSVEARFNCLIDILNLVTLDNSEFDEGELKFHESMLKTAAKKKAAAKT